MKYKAVIFDLFGTLVNNIPHSENEKLFIKMGSILEASGEDVFRLWADIWEQRANGFFNSTKETIVYICNQLGISVSNAKLEYSVQLHHDFLEHMVTPCQYVKEVLNHLKSEGYKTGMITDCSAGTVEIWNKLSLSHLIDVPVFSCQERLVKPDSRIYTLALKRLGVEPQKCLYIGDGGDQELTGATAVGIHAVLIRHPDESMSEVDYGREDWNGTVISSLTEVVNILKEKQA